MTNLLQGFDMVAAITEAAMNTQAYEVFTAKNKDGQDVIQKNIDLTLGDTGIEIKGEIGSSKGGGPWYSLGVPGNQRAIYFHLPITNGSMSYWRIVKGKPEKEELTFTDLEYVFQVNLDFVGIAQAHIQSGTSIPAVVQDHLHNFSDEMFTIRALMTDFENANIANYELTKSKIPEALNTVQGISSLSSALTAYFKNLQGSSNPYILGYSIESKDAKADPSVKPTFVPTGSTFSSFLNVKNSDLDTLNFLLMTGGADVPGGGAGMFTTDWVTSTSYDGKFVIGEPLFFTDWLLPTIQDALSLQTVSQVGKSWVLTSNTDTPQVGKVGDVKYTLRTTGNKNVTVSYANPSSDTAQVTINGLIHRKLEFKAKIIVDEKISGTVDQPFTITATITASSDGQLVVTYQEDIPPMTTHKGGNLLGKLADGLQSTFSNNQEAASAEINLLKGDVQQVLDSLDNSLKGINTRFVMPGGSVFFFKNPQFNDEGDLLADITYKTN